MATQPPSPSSDHDETVILKAPVAGTPPDAFDSDKTVIRRTPAAEPVTPKPKGFSMSFDHPETNDLEATVKVAPLSNMPSASGSSDPLVKRKPGASLPAAAAALPQEVAPRKSGGILKWILGGAAAIVVIILGVAYLLGSNELAAPKVTILKQGTLIEQAPSATAPLAPAVAPEAPAAPPAAPIAQTPAPAPEPASAPAVAAVPAPAPAPPAAIAAAPPAAPAAPWATSSAKPPPDAKAVAAAAAKKAAQDKERLAKQTQAAAPVVSQAPAPVPAAPAPAPAPTPVVAAKVETPPAPVAPPPPAAPSNPNQVCEGRLLFALQTCLSEQCAKPAFTKHAVCVERHAMELRRQEAQQAK